MDIDDSCFDMDIDELEEYASCVVAEEKMRHTMACYKRQMFEAKKTQDRSRYEQVRLHADILAKSLEHVQKTKEKREVDVKAAFERARPGPVDSGDESGSTLPTS